MRGPLEILFPVLFGHLSIWKTEAVLLNIGLLLLVLVFADNVLPPLRKVSKLLLTTIGPAALGIQPAIVPILFSFSIAYQTTTRGPEKFNTDADRFFYQRNVYLSWLTFAVWLTLWQTVRPVPPLLGSRNYSLIFPYPKRHHHLSLPSQQCRVRVLIARVDAAIRKAA